MPAWTVHCQSAELGVEIARIASELELELVPEVSADPARSAIEDLARGTRVALACLDAPEDGGLVGVARAARVARRVAPMACLRMPTATRDLGWELGLPMLEDVRPLVAAIAILESGVGTGPSPVGLNATDRARLEDALGPREGDGRLESADAGRIRALGEGPRILGFAVDVAAALRGLTGANTGSRPAMPTVEGVDPQSVLDIILGPPRALSDPASKAALAAYDVPLPEEELCRSASRAAAEASRIGFPVRVVLASPDLRIWDHPDLAADAVDNAARVRDVFRQMTSVARTRAEDARLLGVTVSATAAARALLRVVARPLDEGLVGAEVGFADRHGDAARDRTQVVLPCTADDLERALRRLAGARLLLEGGAAERRHVLTNLTDALLRVAAFVHEWRAEIVRVRLDPLALLVGGDVEIREALVEVGDAFVRTLDALPAS